MTRLKVSTASKPRTTVPLGAVGVIVSVIADVVAFPAAGRELGAVASGLAIELIGGRSADRDHVRRGRRGPDVVEGASVAATDHDGDSGGHGSMIGQ